jgi:ubiquinone/menaquinone biosynthesis C-methylase UbiE
LFGVPELHSHIRLAAVTPLLASCGLTVELGAGGGDMSLALMELTRRRCIICPFQMTEAQHVKTALSSLSNAELIALVVADASTPFLRENSVDQVLLIDVLEHVDDPERTLDSIFRALKPGGLLVLSVPTPAYVDYFGEQFDRAIGHLRHFRVEELGCALELHGFRVVEWNYHTTGLQAVLCRFWYQRLAALKKLDARLVLLLFPLFLFLVRLRVQHTGLKSRWMPAGIALLARKP